MNKAFFALKLIFGFLAVCIFVVAPLGWWAVCVTAVDETSTSVGDKGTVILTRDWAGIWECYWKAEVTDARRTPWNRKLLWESSDEGQSFEGTYRSKNSRLVGYWIEKNENGRKTSQIEVVYDFETGEILQGQEARRRMDECGGSVPISPRDYAEFEKTSHHPWPWYG